MVRHCCGLVFCVAVAALPGAVAGQEVPIPQLEVLARTDSFEPQHHYRLGRALLKAKRFYEASRAFQRAVDIAPQYAEALLALGHVGLSRGEKYWKKREKAEGVEAVRVALDSSYSRMRLAFLVNPLVLDDMDDDAAEAPGIVIGSLVLRPWWSDPYRKGTRHLFRGRNDEAYRELSRLRDDRRFGERGMRAPAGVLWHHAIAAGRMKAFDEAVRDFSVLTGRSFHEDTTTGGDIVEMPFRTNDFRYAMGTMMLLAGRHDDARATFRRVLEFDIGMWPVHVQLARLHESAGQWEEAIRERERAVESFAENASLHLDLGRTLARAGRNEAALSALQQARTLNPRDPRIPQLQAELLLAAGRDSEARAPLEQFLAIAPARFQADKDAARQELARIGSGER